MEIPTKFWGRAASAILHIPWVCSQMGVLFNRSFSGKYLVITYVPAMVIPITCVVSSSNRSFWAFAAALMCQPAHGCRDTNCTSGVFANPTSTSTDLSPSWWIPTLKPQSLLVTHQEASERLPWILEWASNHLFIMMWSYKYVRPEVWMYIYIYILPILL